MIIRGATVVDEAVMRVLWDEFTAEATYTPYPGVPFSETFLSDGIALIAEETTSPAGCVYAGTQSDHFGFVFGLYVRPNARGRGIGKALMRAVAEELQARQRRYVVLSVDGPNAAARSLYEGLGFTEVAQTLRLPVEQLLT